ncbi:hypothetical protein [Nocardia bhagyanarayanae]|uniref:Mce-associated membrane protein n=1 Tax=Nocardia bhagyanarayanae TaxID=1215925 RepID=A0A543F5C5_9NOCA|nr:hypothetical protein [Nocardia bhagyanarayanae]TQM29032.1 Mce-associated membrane protein [Nocardia bhagyanarayanae]
MSEINGDAHRARRRASRSAGPPEDASSVTEKVTERVGAAAVQGAGSAGAAKGVGAESGATVREADSVSREVRAERADSVGLTKSVGAESADSVELTKSVGAESADSVGLTKGEAAKAGSADSAKDSDSAGSPSVDLGKSEAAKSAAADSDEPDDASADSSRDQLGIGRIVAMAASAVLVLALVAGAVVSTIVARSADAREQRRTEYVQTARQAILNLTTIRADSAKEDIDRILSMASGQFKTEFDGRVDPFLSIVQQAKVVSNGEIVEAALESDADDSAKVLVAAKQTLTNAGQAEPQTRYYRFRVTVTRGDSGLSASNVEFVP